MTTDLVTHVEFTTIDSINLEKKKWIIDLRNILHFSKTNDMKIMLMHYLYNAIYYDEIFEELCKRI